MFLCNGRYILMAFITNKRIVMKNNHFIKQLNHNFLWLKTAMAIALLSSVFLTTVQAEPQEPKAFVYTEVQISLPFDQAPWQNINTAIKSESGFINKTWLAGVGNNSLGGIYAFDSIENAQKFVTGYFPNEARQIGVAHTTRVFDAQAVKEASQDIGSVHFGKKLSQKPAAYVYTELQINVPFSKVPWEQRNPTLKQTPGFLAKTWLSGIHSNSVGGIYAFDSIENAKHFAIDLFPEIAAKQNAAFYTRIFDANASEVASRDMDSPFYQ